MELSGWDCEIGRSDDILLFRLVALCDRLHTPLTILNRRLKCKNKLLLDRLGMLFMESKMWYLVSQWVYEQVGGYYPCCPSEWCGLVFGGSGCGDLLVSGCCHHLCGLWMWQMPRKWPGDGSSCLQTISVIKVWWETFRQGLFSLNERHKTVSLVMKTSQLD